MRMIRILPAAFAALSLAVLAAASFPELKSARLAPHRIMLTWAGDPARTQAVTWRTEDKPGESFAEVALATDGPKFDGTKRVEARTENVETTGGEVAHYHTALIEGLQPSARYVYRVGNEEHMSEWNHFDTASDKPEPYAFIYLGDAQNDVKSLWSRVVREGFKDASDARFVLHAGDLINIPNADHEWRDWFEAGGWIFRRIPSIATPGNHEYARREDGGEGRVLSKYWRPQFEYPLNGPDDLVDTAYYIDYQGTRFISLDSNVDPVPQAGWLEKTLANNPNRWTIVTFHHPVYSAAVRRDNPKIRETWAPLFDRYKVDLVLQGHDHTYGRTGPVRSGAIVGETEQGTVYIVSVSGPKMYEVTTETRVLMSRMAEDTQLFQVLRVGEDSITYEARTPTGTLYDAFELVKHPEGGSRLIDRKPDTPENLRKPKE